MEAPFSATNKASGTSGWREVAGGADMPPPADRGRLPDPGPYRSPESGRRPPSAGGGVPVPSTTSVETEVQDSLWTTLKSASIVDEHRALMGAVIEKIQSAESRLNESCISLIKGFEVCFMSFEDCHNMDSSP